MIHKVAQTCAWSLGHIIAHWDASESFALWKYLSSAMSPALLH